MRTAIKFLLPVVLLLAAGAVFAYLKTTRPERPAAQPSEKVWQVRTLAAEPQRVAPAITLYGNVEAPTELRAAAPGNAVVAAVPVREGQPVRSGELLVRLDARDFQPQVDQAEADVAETEALIRQRELTYTNDRDALGEEQRLLELAQAAVARAERLQRQQLGAESALDESRQALVRQELSLASRRLAVDSHAASLAQLQARLARARATLEQARRDLQRSRVTAPFDGIVSAVEVSTGDRVAAGSVLVALFAPQGLEVRARIPARFQSEIQAALASGQALQARAELAGAPIDLELARLAGNADPSGIDGLFRIRSGAALLRPGNLLELRLQRPPQEDVVAVPMPAIYGNARLYLLREGRLHGVDIESVGQIRDADGGNRLLVRNPELKPGARIVITHLPNAVEGLKVVDQSSASGSGAP